MEEKTKKCIMRMMSITKDLLERGSKIMSNIAKLDRRASRNTAKKSTSKLPLDDESISTYCSRKRGLYYDLIGRGDSHDEAVKIVNKLVKGKKKETFRDRIKYINLKPKDLLENESEESYNHRRDTLYYDLIGRGDTPEQAAALVGKLVKNYHKHKETRIDDGR